MSLPAHLIETMSAAAYTATRTPSFPVWADVTEGYRIDMRKAISAGLQAALNAGLITVDEGKS